MAKNWREFWSGNHSIYANDRHKSAHNAIILADMQALISRNDTVLDFGCGEAPLALELNKHCNSLDLCDGAESVLEDLKERYPQLNVFSPEELAQKTVFYDKIFMVSVLQYLSHEELSHVLSVFKQKLAYGGCVFIADIVPPYVGIVEDTFSLLHMAFKHGFFGAAVVSLVKTALSNYRTLRAKFGLTQFSKPEILLFLHENGFNGEILEHNIGPHQHRFTVKVTL